MAERPFKRNTVSAVAELSNSVHDRGSSLRISSGHRASNIRAHRRTPTLAAKDSRGGTVRVVDYLRTLPHEPAIALIKRQHFDVPGRLVAQSDPRLENPAISTVYALSGLPLEVSSADAGWRLTLPGLAGLPLQCWDGRGSHWRIDYDDQLRMVAIEESAIGDVDSFFYADASAEADVNSRGQLIEQTDASGSLKFASFSLSGAALCETRTFHDGEAFSSYWVLGPDGAVLEQTDAGGHRRRSRYDIAQQLQSVQLQVRGQPGWQELMLDTQYDASGKMIEQKNGNNVTSTWRYHEADGRLYQHTAQVGQQPPLQDVSYEYDPVGNLTCAFDRTFVPTFFRNQRVDGRREFIYDSLYRLHSATGYDDCPPSDIPGLPSPTHPDDRRNYVQTYTYDHGGNLTELRHQRDGKQYTRHMRIEPISNRGIRWTEGDPEPDFSKLFDLNGNLLAVQPGQPMLWTALGELAKVTLVHRDESSDDDEVYRYSQGSRVYKRLNRYAGAINHFRDVRYLPGLEIRRQHNGEELHVITLGNVRCLKWVASPPSGVDEFQLRYSLHDPLGSCVMEVDHQAAVITHEGYYPFGGTAWMAARSAIEAPYKFIRYSGKEMDVSGLYYYGARYYAPWLQRWISPDLAGAVDGLNLYGFVGNNPLSYVDHDGQTRFGVETKAERDARKASSASELRKQSANANLSRAIERHFQFLKILDQRVSAVSSQVKNLHSGSALAGSIAKRSGAFVAKQTVSYGVGIGVGALTGVLGTGLGPVGTAFGVSLGFGAKAATSLAIDYVLEKRGISTSIALKSRKLNPEKVMQKREYRSADLFGYAALKWKKTFDGVKDPTELNTIKGLNVAIPLAGSAAMKLHDTPLAGEIGAMIGVVSGAMEIIYEAERARNGMTPAMEQKLASLRGYVPQLIDLLDRGLEEVNASFDAANRDSTHHNKMLVKLFGKGDGVSRESMAQATNATIGRLRNLHSMLH
ncbi:insecticidal toxin protein [Pseudomonas fluorescens]|uniref:Insecticidal toxin protein n=1 Tax=Pseudomonas fluorescens TaxID=294 RepID=A0A448E0M1_PSEFL|nr:RHS repeat-associated core domain-containing protein [Pseudomonas fluorescens]VEF12578.1 insecticidal toxin protein [Pseudomonas fluorescens]